MPFDGANFEKRKHPSRLPVEIQILDRAKELIATEDRWIKGKFSEYNFEAGVTSYCLYGALLAAEREIAPELSSGTVLVVSTSKLHPRTAAFGRVHGALNAAARPFCCCLSQRESFAMVLNDQARSLCKVHKIMDKARRSLVKQINLRPVALEWEITVQKNKSITHGV